MSADAGTAQGERRRFERLGSWLHSTYRAAGADKATNTLTKNISEGGVGFFTERWCRAGEMLEIEVRSGGHRPVRFSARVAWSEPLLLPRIPDFPRAFETGVHFVDIRPEDQKQLLLYTVLSPPPTAAVK
jgi:hypothetical protein